MRPVAADDALRTAVVEFHPLGPSTGRLLPLGVWNPIYLSLAKACDCMKKLFVWTILAIILMFGCPWLAVEFAGSAGMAVCFILFFAVNPLFSMVCGVFAGKDIKRLWPLPVITAGLFLIGTWLFFEMGETAFLLYCGCYLMIGIVAMLISAFVNKRKQ